MARAPFGATEMQRKLLFAAGQPATQGVNRRAIRCYSTTRTDGWMLQVRSRPADALAAVAQHRWAFPDGRLVEEREAICVLALVAGELA
jgi:hypothetical protein